MDTREAKEKIKEYVSIDKIVENLPMILLIGGGLLLLDKLLKIGVKLEPFFRRRRKFRKNRFFEIIDTLGDNIQIFDMIAKLFKIEFSKVELKKIGDLLQNIGTGGKHISTLYDLIQPKVGGLLGRRDSGRFKELQ